MGMKKVILFFPNELTKFFGCVDETTKKDIFSLPHESGDENQIYDRGKKCR